MRFVRVSREKWDEKRTPKIRRKTRCRTAVKAGEKKKTENRRFARSFTKNVNFEKKSRKYNLQGFLSQKIKNSMSRFCTLLALSSTNTPVVQKISFYQETPELTDHSARTILGFWICVFFVAPVFFLFLGGFLFSWFFLLSNFIFNFLSILIYAR